MATDDDGGADRGGRRKLKLTVEYDGSEFAGFQSQAAGIRTVQDVLAAAVEEITGARETIYGAGRTDAGVHALGQVAHFSTGSNLPADRVRAALNAVLPRDVSVSDVSDVGAGFHARYSALSRLYVYQVLNTPTRSALWRRYALHEPRTLDVDAMSRVAARLVGVNDYAAFAAAGGNPGATTVRRLERLQVRRARGGRILIIAEANAFLRSMVRNLAGALVAAGRGAMSPEAAETVLRSRDRTQNPCETVPAHGLVLVRVAFGAERSGIRAAEVAEDEEG